MYKYILLSCIIHACICLSVYQDQHVCPSRVGSRAVGHDIDFHWIFQVHQRFSSCTSRCADLKRNQQFSCIEMLDEFKCDSMLLIDFHKSYLHNFYHSLPIIMIYFKGYDCHIWFVVSIPPKQQAFRKRNWTGMESPNVVHRQRPRSWDSCFSSGFQPKLEFQPIEIDVYLTTMCFCWYCLSLITVNWGEVTTILFDPSEPQ